MYCATKSVRLAPSNDECTVKPSVRQLENQGGDEILSADLEQAADQQLPPQMISGRHQHCETILDNVMRMIKTDI